MKGRSANPSDLRRGMGNGSHTTPVGTLPQGTERIAEGTGRCGERRGPRRAHVSRSRCRRAGGNRHISETFPRKRMASENKDQETHPKAPGDHSTLRASATGQGAGCRAPVGGACAPRPHLPHVTDGTQSLQGPLHRGPLMSHVIHERSPAVRSVPATGRPQTASLSGGRCDHSVCRAGRAGGEAAAAGAGAPVTPTGGTRELPAAPVQSTANSVAAEFQCHPHVVTRSPTAGSSQRNRSQINLPEAPF